MMFYVETVHWIF